MNPIYKTAVKNIVLGAAVGVTLFCVSYLSGYSAWGLGILSVFAVAVIVVVLNGLDKDRRAAVLHLLEEECDPQAYLNQLESCFGTESKSSAAYDMLKASALWDLGQANKAIALVERADVERLKRRTDDAFLYYSNLAEIALYRRDTALISHCLEQINSLPIRRAAQPLVADLNRFYQAMMLKLEGRLRESKDKARCLTCQIYSRRFRMYVIYHLALIELMLNNTQAAKQYLTIVALEGNKLFIAEDAGRKLAALA